jgi:hypothetical protein
MPQRFADLLEKLRSLFFPMTISARDSLTLLKLLKSQRQSLDRLASTSRSPKPLHSATIVDMARVDMPAKML